MRGSIHSLSDTSSWHDT